MTKREAVLLGQLLHGDRYGLELREGYQRETGEHLPLGSLYTTLDRMEAKGLVQSRLGKSGHPAGGNRRRYYSISGAGDEALRAGVKEWALMRRLADRFLAARRGSAQ